MKWPEDINEAKKIQDKLRNRITITPLRKIPKIVAGVDASFLDDKVIGTACLYSYPIEYKGKVVGAVLRTKDDVKPLFVSPGHRIDLKGSIEIVLNCLSKYRIPEPLRRADSISKKIKPFISNSYKSR